MIHVTPGGHGLGWTGPSPADPRDYLLAAAVPTTLPARVNLNAQCPPVMDQGPEGSCTAHAAAVMAYQTYVKDGWHNPFPPAPRFIYYTERQLLEQPPYNVANATSQDTGGFSRLVVQALAQYGMTAEHNCPYRDASGNPLPLLGVAPDAAAYTNAHKHLAVSYLQLSQTQQAMQACLATGWTFIFGFTVYESFESAQVASTGIVPMPAAGERMLGGHEMAAIGYEQVNGALYIRCRNSWGPYFGQGGDVLMPIAYLLNASLASDLWTLRTQH